MDYNENQESNKPVTPRLSKKQLFMTAIAAITLLSVVVGATYAYFTFTSTISSGTNTITNNIGKAGNVTLTATTSAMHITTTAMQFQNTGSVQNYWATKTSGSNYATSEETNTINTLQAASGTTSTTIYECTYTLTVTTTGLPDSGMSSGDYVVYVKGVGSTVTLDMATVANRTKSYTVTRYLSGTTAKTVTTSAKLVNRKAAQNYLKGLTIVTTFTASDLSCSLVASAGTDALTEVTS